MKGRIGMVVLPFTRATKPPTSFTEMKHFSNGTDPKSTMLSLRQTEQSSTLTRLFTRSTTTASATTSYTDRIRAMLDQHPRTATGGFWHRDPKYPNQTWLDGIFMADVFYARWTALFDAKNITAWGDIILQWDKIEAVTRDAGTGLLVHGFDESKTAISADPGTRASPLVWNRAVGWYFISLIEILDIYPKYLEGYDRLLGYYKRLAMALLSAQERESHGWWLVLSKQYICAEGNYFESSAAAMFTYGWLAGLRRGYLDEKTYSMPAAKAHKHLITNFVEGHRNGTLTWEGTVQVGSLNTDASFEVSALLRQWMALKCITFGL
ncbi:glycosyl hydrolase family 88-domain-containing protein [Aspergillus spectabilis]